MRACCLPDSDEWMTVEDALRLITSYTDLLRARPLPNTYPEDIKPRFSREQNEQALRDAYDSGTVMLQDEESMRVGNPSKHIDSTRQRVTAKIKSSSLAAIAGRLWISLADVQGFADQRFVDTYFARSELIQSGYTLYDVENELGHTIQGAARALAKKYSISAGAMKQRIFEAAQQGKLQVRDPQTGMEYVPKERSVHHERISISDLNKWLEGSGVAYRLHKNAGAHADAAAVHAKVELPINDSRTAGESGAVAGRNGSATWQAEARCVANQLHLKDKKAGAYSSLEDLADRIAKEFRTSGIEGPRGPLSGATILREALQGGRWKRPTS